MPSMPLVKVTPRFGWKCKTRFSSPRETAVVPIRAVFRIISFWGEEGGKKVCFYFIFYVFANILGGGGTNSLRFSKNIADTPVSALIYILSNIYWYPRIRQTIYTINVLIWFSNGLNIPWKTYRNGLCILGK